MAGWSLIQTMELCKMWEIVHQTSKTQQHMRTSQVIRIQQGQNRVINVLIYQVLETNCGIQIGSLHMPSILLTNDTTPLNGSKDGGL